MKTDYETRMDHYNSENYYEANKFYDKAIEKEPGHHDNI